MRVIAGYNRADKKEPETASKAVNIIMYIRKTIDEWQLMSNYGYGWECEVSYDNRKDAITDLRLYRENSQGSHRLIKKRIAK